MANFYRLIPFFLFLFPSVSFASVWAGPGPAPVGWINLAGWIKNADGTNTRAFSDGNGTTARVTLTSAPKGITTTSTALVQTSKGITAMDIVKTANVNTARLGSGMVALAKKAGPLGMTLTAASLVCELTSICNDAGNWVFNNPFSNADDYPPTTPVGFYIAGGRNGTQSASQSQSCKQLAGLDLANSKTTSEGAICKEFYPDGVTLWRNVAVYWVGAGSCPTHYTLTGSSCVLNESAAGGAPSSTDWDSAATKLNDDRVTPHLIDAGESVPTDSVPTLTAGQKKGLGLDSVPTKDSSGNVTGREDTTTEIEAVDAGTADNPGAVIIKETKTTVKYDNSNTQISSTTNTSYTNQPERGCPIFCVKGGSINNAGAFFH
ncbi:MAG: hypothetical protein DU489_03240 [Nitrosomonas sp.]|uniref:hypothetical protein n=1 Tax=Nitrosomonas sp. TaxID=42353 RepID=UPI0032ED9517